MSSQHSAGVVTRIFRPLPPVLAHTRLKSNVLALILSVFLRYVFTPYRTIRRGLIWYADEYLQHRVGGQPSQASQGFWLLETAITAVLLWNIVEAAVSVKYPSQPPQPSNSQASRMMPAKVSSPLTRPYSPSVPGTPVRSTALPSTPMSGIQSTSVMQRYSTPVASQGAGTSTPSRLHHSASFRSSPLSASTSKIFNIPTQVAESDGLFFDPKASASPSKVGVARTGDRAPANQPRPQQQQPPPQQSGSGTQASARSEADGFVLVEKEEKEFIENIWTGVRARAGPADL